MNAQGPNSKNSKLFLPIMFLLALSISIFFFARAGFVLFFWMSIIAWLLFFFFYFRFFLLMSITVQFLIFILIFALSVVFMIAAGPKDDSNNVPTASSGTSSAKVVNGVTLAPCTSTLANTPVMPKGWSNITYAAPLNADRSADPKDATEVRTFSYKGIVDETEKNSIFSTTEKTTKTTSGFSEYMTGDSAAIEVCNEDNMQNENYRIDSGHNTPAGENTTGMTYYLHGGKYIFGPGTYRIDAYLKIGNGEWQLINRMSDITITP